MPSITYRDDLAVLELGADENRFSCDFMNGIHSCLDSIPLDAAGLVTIGVGKFYSNGLDQGPTAATVNRSVLSDLQCILARILVFPLPTVAAVNGHAFGAGAMFALAHDYRIMRTDRGYYCFPEVDLDVPFTTGMSKLIQAKLPARSAHIAMTTGQRFDSSAALEAGLVDAATDEEQLLNHALAQLVPPVIGKRKETLAAIKSTMYESTATALLQL